MIELIGGSSGVAYKLIRESLKNKKLVAEHMTERQSDRKTARPTDRHHERRRIARGQKLIVKSLQTGPRPQTLAPTVLTD